MQIAELVDDFVRTVNSRERECLPLAEVPERLRKELSETDGYTRWQIVPSNNSAATGALEEKLQKRFPSSFRHFLSHYSFPQLEVGPIDFFANTGQGVDRELSVKLFHDPAMSPVLLKGGFLQIGNPDTADYDPICFNLNISRDEHPIVRLDHESILMFSKLEITEEIAPSFIDFMKATFQGKAA